MQDFPAAFLDGIRELLGAECGDFLDAMEKRPVQALRANPKRAYSPAGERVPWEENGRYAPEDFHPGRDIAHFAGAYYPQDASAMAPARALNALPGETILDLCAAPGGKSGQIAAMMKGRGILISNEIEFSRAKILSSVLERQGFCAGAVTSENPARLAEKWPGLFDGVLVDAPCSGEGMFRKDPEALSNWSAEAVAGCARRQAEILRSAAALVKPGGRLVYSSCTFNKWENEENIRLFLREHPDFSPGRFALLGVGESREGCIRLWPHKRRGEGHFAALLVREGESEGEKRRLKADAAARDALLALLGAFPGDWMQDFEGWTPNLAGDVLSLLPPGLPDLSGLRALRAGLRAGRARVGRVEPEHALAMAVDPKKAPAAPLTEDEALSYLFGEAPKAPGRGWAVASWRALPLGLGKLSEGVLKNHLPKGLRVKINRKEEAT